MYALWQDPVVDLSLKIGKARMLLRARIYYLLTNPVSDDGGETQRHGTRERHAQGQPQRRGVGKTVSKMNENQIHLPQPHS